MVLNGTHVLSFSILRVYSVTCSTSLLQPHARLLLLIFYEHLGRIKLSRAALCRTQLTVEEIKLTFLKRDYRNRRESGGL